MEVTDVRAGGLIRRRVTVRATSPEAGDPSVSRADASLSRALSVFSQRVSRRGLLARAGGVLLGAVGISAIGELLPVGRGVSEALHALSNCSVWKYCGMCGQKCDCCNGTERDESRCPGCAGGIDQFWSACCCRPDQGLRYNVQYWDCMQTGGCPDTKKAECHNCTGCNNGCPQPYWTSVSDPASKYLCTKVVVTTTCGVC